MSVPASPPGSPGTTLRVTRGSPGRRQRQPDTTVFGYQAAPDVPQMNRGVFRWVQSLDLSHSLKSVRRDVANGFLVAEIFSRYFPNDIQMHGFANATSSRYKRDNWQQIQRFCLKQGINLPSDLVEGTAAGVHGAAAALLEHLYTLLTGKKVEHAVIDPNALSAASTLAQVGGGGNDAADVAGRAISSTLKPGAAIEFGSVQTVAVAEDPLQLRRKLASRA